MYYKRKHKTFQILSQPGPPPHINSVNMGLRFSRSPCFIHNRAFWHQAPRLDPSM